MNLAACLGGGTIGTGRPCDSACCSHHLANDGLNPLPFLMLCQSCDLCSTAVGVLDIFSVSRREHESSWYHGMLVAVRLLWHGTVVQKILGPSSTLCAAWEVSFCLRRDAFFVQVLCISVHIVQWEWRRGGPGNCLRAKLAALSMAMASVGEERCQFMIIEEKLFQCGTTWIQHGRNQVHDARRKSVLRHFGNLLDVGGWMGQDSPPAYALGCPNIL